MKSDRGGIGADEEKKRKIREEFEKIEGVEKRRKVDAEEYRERVVREREEKRMEGQLLGSRKVVERLVEEDEGNSNSEVTSGQQSGRPDSEDTNLTSQPTSTRRKPLKSIKVLYRSMIRDRELADRDRRLRHDFQSSPLLSSSRTNYDDTEEDVYDKLANGSSIAGACRKDEIIDDADLDEEDVELDEFEALPVAEKLRRVVAFLREKWYYCFWCKFRYPDKSMDGCPGTTEDDHD